MHEISLCCKNSMGGAFLWPLANLLCVHMTPLVLTTSNPFQGSVSLWPTWLHKTHIIGVPAKPPTHPITHPPPPTPQPPWRHLVFSCMFDAHCGQCLGLTSTRHFLFSKKLHAASGLARIGSLFVSHISTYFMPTIMVGAFYGYPHCTHTTHLPQVTPACVPGGFGWHGPRSLGNMGFS